MSFPVPLTVRLANDYVDRHVTRELSDLSFRGVSPGGFASASLPLVRPLTFDEAQELSVYTPVTISSEEDGNIAWNGWLEDPGTNVGSDGMIRELTAIGPSSHVTDRTVPYILRTRLDFGWIQLLLQTAPNLRKSGGRFQTSSSEDDENTQLLLGVDQGTAVPQDGYYAARFNAIYRAGMKLARIHHAWDAGFTSTAWSLSIAVRTGPTGAGTGVDTTTISTAGGVLDASVTTDFSAGPNVTDLWLIRTGVGTTIADDNVWITSDPSVWAIRMSKNGIEVTGSGAYDGPFAAYVVEDLLGRLLPLYDGPTAIVGTPAASGHVFFEMAYPDGVTPEKVLEDLMLVHTDMTWGAWEQHANGRYAFEWTPLGTTPRFEFSARDGLAIRGSAVDLFNRARVRYRASSQAYKSIQRTSSVPELDNAGRVRELFVDLGDEIADLTTAQQAGDSQLATRNKRPAAGTITISRPVLDRDTGMMIKPWELVRRGPGQMCSIQETGEEHQIISVDYSASSASAVLELDAPAVGSLSRLVAQVSGKPQRRTTTRIYGLSSAGVSRRR